MKRIALLLFIIFISVTAQPQRVNHVFKGESLAEVLKILDRESSDYRINFIFDELEDFVVTTSFKNKTIPNAIRDVVGFYPIRIVTDENNRNIFIECIQKGGGRLIGKLIDQHSNPVIYANIALLNVQDSSLITGGVSSESGDFVIPTNRKRVLMRVSCVGYKTLYDIVDVKAIGTVRMRTKTMLVKTVMAKTHRPAYRIGKEGLIVNVQGTNLSYVGTAKDVLGMLPNITTENGDISIFGQEGSPLIYINGKKVLHSNELTLLKSDEINSVEVITAPGIHYDATVTAVIKIKTVKKKGDGLGGVFETNVKMAHRGSANNSASLNYRMGGLDVSSSISYDNSRLHQRQTTLWEIRNLVKKNSALVYDVHKMDLNGQVQLNYVFGDNRSAGFTYYIKRQHSIGEGNNHIQSILFNGTKEDYPHRMRFERTDRPTHCLSTYYNGKIGKLNLNFDIDYMYTGNRFGNLSYVEKSHKNYSVNSQNNNCSRFFALKNVLVYPLWKGKLNAGFECTHTGRNSLFSCFGGIESVTDDEIKECSAAFFAGYDITLGSFSASTGIRYEHTRSKYYQFKVFNKSQSPKYNEWFPSVSFGYCHNRTAFRISYTTETRRPAYENLSGNRLYNDEYVYEGGNPLLRFSKIHTLSLEAQYRRFTLLSTYADIHNDIVWLDQLYGEKAVLYTPVNIPRRMRFHMLLTFAHRIRCWQPRYSIGLSKQILNLSEQGIDSPLGKPYWMFKFYNTFHLSKSFWLELKYGCFTTGNELTMYNKASHILSVLAYKYFLKDKLSVRLKINDILKTHHNKNIYQGINMMINRTAYLDTRSITLTFAYRFNTADSKYKGTGAGKREKKRL